MVVFHSEVVFIYKHYALGSGVAIRVASASMHLGWGFQSYRAMLGGVNSYLSLLQGREA